MGCILYRCDSGRCKGGLEKVFVGNNFVFFEGMKESFNITIGKFTFFLDF